MLAPTNQGDIRATFDLTHAWPSPVTAQLKGKKPTPPFGILAPQPRGIRHDPSLRLINRPFR